MNLVFATGNRGKLREASEILGKGFELVTPADRGLREEIPETGSTLRANSYMKARYIYDKLNCDCFADDTGLEAEILGGAPGVMTARFAGEPQDTKKNIIKLLTDMSEHQFEASRAREYGLDMNHATRRACFRTVVTLILNGEQYFFDGVLEGRIALRECGEAGFGYDPVFIPDEIPGEDGALVPNAQCLTLAQISEDAKNQISHRGKAMRAMAEFLQNR